MEDLALIGISHKRGGAEALESYQAAYPAGSSLALPEYVLLATCNRWTLVTRCAGVQALRQRFQLAGSALPYAYQGEGALEHLSRIASSLESLNPGEDQITGQVRQAFEAAQARGTTHTLTHYAFETALRIAKKVRTEVELAPLNTSLFSLTRPRLETQFASASAASVSAVILGAGEMGSLAAMNLKGLAQFALTIVNRDLSKAQRLAEQVGGRALALADFLACPPSAQLLVCATPVAQLISPALARQVDGLELIIDLGLPRNVHPEVAAHIDTLDVDSLRQAGDARRSQLMQQLAKADALVQREVMCALDSWNEKQLGRSIYALRQTYLETVQRTLGDAVAPELAKTLAHRFAHIPTKGLRAIAREHGLHAAQTFLQESGLEEPSREPSSLESDASPGVHL